MGQRGHTHGRLTTEQLSPKTWPDFETLFARHGGVWGGCWCMFYHAPVGFDASAYEKNRRAKGRLVREGKAHGSIVYCAGEPVGGVSSAPRGSSRASIGSAATCRPGTARGG